VVSTRLPAEAGISFGSEMREAARARLLRRADWRFLLDRPVPEKVWCCCEAELREAVSAVSVSVADVHSAPQGDCDLAVLTEPDGAALRRAWAALSPGGACYAEWSSLGVAGSGGMRKLLRAAGFELVRCYVPWRAPPRAYLWLPLKSRGALRHFLGRPLPGRNRLRRRLYAMRRAATALAHWFGVLRPICAVALKPAYHLGDGAPGDEDSQLEGHPTSGGEFELIAHARAEWIRWGLGDAPGRLSWMLRTAGWRTSSKVVGFVIAEPNPEPRLVVKISRVPESIPALLREAEILESLQAIRPGGVPGIPRLLFCREARHSVVIGETAREGVPLGSILSRRNYRDLALKATDWLAELAVTSRVSTGGSACTEVIDPALEEFQRSFGEVLDPGMLRESADLLAGLRALPRICEHRDFIPWNVLVDSDGALGVIDWEAGELRGVPAVDMIYFLSYLGFVLDRALPPNPRMIHSYRTGTDPHSLTGAVHHECLSRYFDETGMDPAAVRPLRQFTWILHSRFEYQRMVADFGPSPGPEVLRRSVLLRLWEAEVRQAREA
jgi:hypothetical protein